MGVINPLAAICAMQMMLETLGEDEAAEKIDQAVRYVTGNKLKSLAAKDMGYSTSEVGDMVAEQVAS
jgi:3-isopropylmalate dehydrogenase